MPHPILVTGAAGGQQGSTGRFLATLLLEKGLPIRAFVHKLDARSDELLKKGAEIIEGDLLNPASVMAAMKGVKRAYFTYPVADGLLEAATIFATSARDTGLELVVNNSQLQGVPDDPLFRDLQHTPSFRNLQHRLADRIFDWAQIGVVHIQAPPYYENVRALVSRSVTEQNAVFLPWGVGDAVIPLTGSEDVARVAATLLVGPIEPSKRIYPLVSETLTVRQIVETLGKAIGRPIRYVPITDEQWVDAVKERINPHALDHLSHLWQYFRDSKERRMGTNTIREVTGQHPKSLEEFFGDNVKSFGTAAQYGSFQSYPKKIRTCGTMYNSPFTREQVMKFMPVEPLGFLLTCLFAAGDALALQRTHCSQSTIRHLAVAPPGFGFAGGISVPVG